MNDNVRPRNPSIILGFAEHTRIGLIDNILLLKAYKKPTPRHQHEMGNSTVQRDLLPVYYIIVGLFLKGRYL